MRKPASLDTLDRKSFFFFFFFFFFLFCERIYIYIGMYASLVCIVCRQNASYQCRCEREYSVQCVQAVYRGTITNDCPPIEGKVKKIREIKKKKKKERRKMFAPSQSSSSSHPILFESHPLPASSFSLSHFLSNSLSYFLSLPFSLSLSLPFAYAGFLLRANKEHYYFIYFFFLCVFICLFTPRCRTPP